MHTLENPTTRWRGLITLATIILICLGSALIAAPPAEAKTFYVKPIPSWICSTFNICKTARYCYQGNPNIAYDVTVPPWRCYTVRY